jgi:hypothetical protein
MPGARDLIGGRTAEAESATNVGKDTVSHHNKPTLTEAAGGLVVELSRAGPDECVVSL